MNNPVYVGIENEIMAYFAKGGYVKFNEYYWNQLLEKYKSHFFKRAPTAIRTKSGSAIYLDGDPEVNTHPVRVEPGFAQKAADSLYLARKELVDFVSPDDLRLIGYSMHWNISDVVGDYNDTMVVLNRMAVPYSLFALNPLSCGINMRYKDEGSGKRLELLGDHIEDEDQIRAFLLFYAASIVNFRANQFKLPIRTSLTLKTEDRHYPNLVPDGRYSEIEVVELRSGSMTITAQNYLEIYFEFFRKGIEQLGTPEEVKNLEDFVYGRKKLEIDQFKRFAIASLFKKNKKTYFEYAPELCMNPNKYSEDREIPTPMGRFLGSLADKTNMFVREDERQFSVSSMEWGGIVIEDVESLEKNVIHYFEIRKLENIDFIAEVLFEMIERGEHEHSSNKYFTRLVKYALNHGSFASIPKGKNGWKQTSINNQHLKRAVLSVFERMYCMCIGDIAAEDFDAYRRLGELEKRVLEYNPNEDDFPNDELDTAVKAHDDIYMFSADSIQYKLPGELEFSLWRAIKNSNPYIKLGDRMKFFTIGAMISVFLGSLIVGLSRGCNNHSQELQKVCGWIETPESMQSYDLVRDNECIIDPEQIIETEPSSWEESFEFVPNP